MQKEPPLSRRVKEALKKAKAIEREEVMTKDDIRILGLESKGIVHKLRSLLTPAWYLSPIKKNDRKRGARRSKS